MTRLLARRFEADEEAKGLVNLIVSGVERGQRLISDLLDYSQLSERQRGQPGPVDASASTTGPS